MVSMPEIKPAKLKMLSKNADIHSFFFSPHKYKDFPMRKKVIQVNKIVPNRPLNHWNLSRLDKTLNHATAGG